jgi:hypothetical protein
MGWMRRAARQYEYYVERELGGRAYADIRLVRRAARRGSRGRLGSHDDRDGTVLFHRSFKPMLELDRLQGYASLLERVAQHANEGTLGCFVETDSRGGEVRITLYERWFDGAKLHCEELASRLFDASDESALVESAEFRGELEQWAEDQNAAREESYLGAAADEQARTERVTEQAAAAAELAKILSRIGHDRA